MNARVQSLALLTFAACLIRLACSDILLNYVRAGARPLVFGGALVVASVGLWRLLTPNGVEVPTTRAAWLLLAPVFTVAIVSPPPLGVLTANQRSNVPRRPDDALAALPRTDPVQIKMSDLVVRSYWDHGRTLRGHTLRVVGFVSATTKTGFVMSRLVITCCAADAEPDRLEVTTAQPTMPVGTWIEVTGGYADGSAFGPYVPRVAASDVRQIKPPANPYD